MPSYCSRSAPVTVSGSGTGCGSVPAPVTTTLVPELDALISVRPKYSVTRPVTWTASPMTASVVRLPR